jgi:ubiquinone biosynthesis protein
LTTGEEVIVKVQRPDMDELVARDSTVLLHLARVMEQRTPIGKDLHAAELADDFVRGLFDELDFVLEGANAVDISLATAENSGVRIPHVYTALVTRRVLVEERLRGVNVADRERMAELGLDPAAVADRLVRAMVDQLLHGHFHADPHPGNVLLLDDGSIGFIDFGMTGRLDASQRAALLQITLSASQGDAAGLRDGIQQVAIVGADVSDIELERALARFISLHLRPGTNVGAQAMSELVPLLSTYDIHLPGEMTMCLRALAMLDGTVHAVDPGYALIEGMQRLIGGTTISEAATGEIGDQLRDELLRELPRLRRLPSHLERIASLTARGELRTRVSLFSSVEDARVVTTLANRMILALAGSLLLVGSAISLALTSAASESGPTSLAEVFGVLGASIGIVLVLRVVAAVVRDGYQ